MSDVSSIRGRRCARRGLDRLMGMLRESQKQGITIGEAFKADEEAVNTTSEDCASTMSSSVTSQAAVGPAEGSWLSRRLADTGGSPEAVFDLTPKPTLELPTIPIVDFIDKSKRFEIPTVFPTTTSLVEPTEFPDVVLNNLDATDVEKKIIRQMEFYFGDHNLPKDRFLVEVLESQGGWVPMTTMMTFPRLAAFTKDPKVVLAALDKSPNNIIEVDRDFVDSKTGTVGRIRRNPSKPVPIFDDARQVFVEERTVFVSGFPREDVTLDQLLEFFENQFEKVANVRMRFSRRQWDNAPDFLGSVFVTFHTKEAAAQFIQCHSDNLRFFGRALKVKWQHEFFSSRPEFNDAFRRSAFDRTVFVSGFDRPESMTQDDLELFFRQFDGTESVQRRLFRDRRDAPWKFTGSVFVTFKVKEQADHFLSLPDVSHGGDRLIRKSQLQFFEEKGLFRLETKRWMQEASA